MTYRSKSISLAEEVWEAFDRMRVAHGSYNKALRHMLTSGRGAESDNESVILPRETQRRDERPARKPLLKPSQRRKGVQ